MSAYYFFFSCDSSLVGSSMEKSTEVSKAEWMSVPAFGEWEKQQGFPDYSLDFSKIRQMRKQSKTDCSSISVGNDDELLPHPRVPPSANSRTGSAVAPAIHRQHSPSGRKKIKSYFVCCIRA